MDTKYKISRSPVLRAIAFCLCAVLLGIGTSCLFYAILEAADTNITPRDLAEADYLQSETCYYERRDIAVTLAWLLKLRGRPATASNRGSETAVYDASAEYAEEYSSSTGEYGMSASEKEYEIQRLKRELEQKSEGFLYYATDGDTIISNTDQAEPDFFQSLPSRYIADNVNQIWEAYPALYDYPMDYSDFFAVTTDNEANIRIYVGMDNTVLEERSQAFAAEVMQIKNFLRLALLFYLGALLCFIYLCLICGRRPDDQQIHLLPIDRLWSEVLLAAVIGVPLLAAGIAATGLEKLGEQVYLYYEFLFSAFLTAAGVVWLAFLFSVIRLLKKRMFIKNSILYKVLRWLYLHLRDALRTFVQAVGHVGSLPFRMICAVVLFEGALLLLGLFCIAAIGAFLIWFLLFLVLNFFVLRKLAKMAKETEAIADGVKAVKSGDLAYKIEVADNGLLGEMAENINGISEGLKNSVEKEIKAERMKAELITNVSHDLKTPLTAILNYADLLSKESLTPDYANDYVKVIKEKSSKLKNLTQDLFDISKAQSGNIKVQNERLDLALLIKQALGEAEEKLSAADLDIRFRVTGGAAEIIGDGNLLSRVAENLIGNIVKYALAGTRVYIDLSAAEGQVTATFKNIAGYEMDFEADSLTERFVRGDAARSTEGSGLGLAIAKSYVEACGGQLSLTIDGDLFKVQLTFPAYR